MATVAPPPRREFNREETQRKVRHPLQTVRKIIRGYVLLEGVALAILFVSAWFWAGLFLDYGTFRLFAFDWLQELRDVAPESSNALFIRLLLLGVLFLILAALVVTKVGLRWIREFNDKAVALVLERRFPKELGDRLITAVELADPKQTTKFGYSEAMIEQTIQDAVQRIDRLPVAGVFNWRRLVGWWLLVGLVTFGVLIVVTIFTLVIGLVIGDISSPLELPLRMKDVAMIATERNLLLQNTYWPRRAHLEFARFQAKAGSPNEMRVPREEQRANLRVRAIEWVIADRSASDGWRPLRWADLPTLFTSAEDKALLDRVSIPEAWEHWVIDLDDLDASVPSGLLPAAWQGRSSGDIHKARAADKLLQANIHQAQSEAGVDRLLNWKEWTVDQIGLQMKKEPATKNATPVSVRLREIDAYVPLEAVFSRLGELTDSAWMSRTVRRLDVPTAVTVVARGDTVVLSKPLEDPVDNKFAFDLNELKESSRVRIRAEDYYTPAKRITLVAPPSVGQLVIDKEEPAYLYHRLQNREQLPLKGKKQLSTFKVSLTGELSTADVPLGTDLVLRAEVDRKLREPVLVTVPTSHDAGSIVPDRTVQLGADGKSFTLEIKNVTRTLDFNIEFSDEDNVRGKRHIRIRPIEDQPPKFESDVGLSVVLRKPRARITDKGVSLPDAYLITPNAVLPFVGTIRDDHGLTRVGWQFEADPLFDLELSGLGKTIKDKLPAGLLAGNRLTRQQRTQWIASAFMYTPAHPVPGLMIPAHVNGVRRIIEADPSRNAFSIGLTFAMNDAFEAELQRRAVEEIPLAALENKLREAAVMPKGPEFSLRYEGLPEDDYLRTAFEPRFSVNKHMRQLKDEINTSGGQIHYLLKLSVLATDNNVETGKPWFDATGRTSWGNDSTSKTPFRFLVVSETELLTQIALEEESLFERLEKAYDKLKNAKSLTDDQLVKLSSPAMKDEEMGLVAIRLNEVRNAVIDAGGGTREVHSIYANILGELKVNRVRKDHVEKVHEKIVWPLERAVHPEDGNFVRCDKQFQDIYQDVDNDVNANAGVKNRPLHHQKLQAASKELEELMLKLNSVLIALDLGMTEAKERERLVMIERIERAVRDGLILRHETIIREFLKSLEDMNKQP